MIKKKLSYHLNQVFLKFDISYHVSYTIPVKQTIKYEGTLETCHPPTIVVQYTVLILFYIGLFIVALNYCVGLSR